MSGMQPITGIAGSILAMFAQGRAAQEAELKRKDTEAATELVSQMQELAENAAFKRLLAELAPAHDAVYALWLDGKPVSPEQQAFARFVQLLRTRPAALVEHARQLLTETRSM